MKKKKAFYLMMACVMALAGIWSADISAKAAVKWGTPVDTGYYWAESGEISIMKVNGRHAYCLEPDQYVSTTSGYKEQEHNMKQSQWERLIKIAHFGYNREKNTNADYAATQIMIWRQLWIWKGIEPASIKDTNVPGLSDKIDAIEREIREYDEMIKNVPSFASNGIQVNSGKSIEVKDTSGALTEYPYSVSSAKSGIRATIDRNSGTLSITAGKEMEGESYVTLTLEADNLIGSNRFYYHKSSQDVGNIGYIADVSLRIPVKVDNTGNISLIKKSGSGKLISGAVFEISSEDGTFVKEYTTGNDGMLSASDLVQGTYIVKEKEVPEPYLLDSSEKKVTVTAGETVQVEFENLMPAGRFTLTKTDKGSSLLENAVFEIYSQGCDPEGNEIGFRGEFTTDEKGEIILEDLVPGIYFYREIKAPDGYILDGNEYKFEISYKDSQTPVIEVNAAAVNEEPTGSITLKKDFAKDQEVTEEEMAGATLEGAVYGLYAADTITDRAGNTVYFEKDEMAGRFVTDRQGWAGAVTGLPMGAYYVKEIEAPKGCVLDESRHEMILEYKDQNTAEVETQIMVEDMIEKIEEESQPPQKTPEKPEAPEPDIPKEPVKTGDAFPVGAVITLAAMGLLGTCFMAVRRNDRK